MILIVAGSMKQYYEYCRTNNIDTSNVRYLSAPYHFHGFDIENSVLVKVGTWYNRESSYIQAIRDLEDRLIDRS